eukprot:TRINITY_DN7680_c0_g1_i10.p1 TRINITY_DN7680_c0_g1~~TRINITY_DN7680_c0_g1_i10.p1  ORF type:complete len:289 (-),score=49.53 TRINITY_DN7680_c0_g1_i10:36-902(-)
MNLLEQDPSCFFGLWQTQQNFSGNDYRVETPLDDPSEKFTNHTSVSIPPGDQYNCNNNIGQAPHLHTKIIQKRKFDPLIVNDRLYIYENDPVEYKKARKRLQNRESAVRVRSKNKEKTEDLKEEVDLLRKENNELKVKIASINAENALLKHNIAFLEKLIVGNGSVVKEPLNEFINTQQNSENHVITIESEPNFYREDPKRSGTRDYLLLGVFTTLLVIYGAMTNGEAGTSEGPASFNKPGSFAPKALKDIGNEYPNRSSHLASHQRWWIPYIPVSYTHLTLPTIYSV